MFHYASSFNQPISQSMVTVGSKTYEAWNVKKASSLRSTFAFYSVLINLFLFDHPLLKLYS